VHQELHCTTCGKPLEVIDVVAQRQDPATSKQRARSSRSVSK
jgi:hypothetical protein